MFCIFITSPILANENKEISLYSYHLKAPFITDLDNKKGLTYELAKYLSTKINGYTFKVKYIPRKRLDKHLSDKIVLWVNPIWFKDKKQTKYLWSINLLEDEDLIISRRNKKLEFTKVDDLIGKLLIIPRGFYYWNLDAYLKSQKIKKLEVNSEHSGFKLMTLGRADGAIISRSTLNYLFVREPDAKAKIHISNVPLDTFSRKILFPKGEVVLKNRVNEVIESMKTDSSWQEVLRRFQ